MRLRKQPWWKIVFGEIYFTAFNGIYTIKQGEKETEFLIRVLQIKKGTRVLDLACGQGRHAIALAQHGMDVVGVDASRFLLHVARQRARAAKINVSFVKRDMRTYREAGKYDIILILGNSFGYFNDKDNEQVLNNVAASLKIGGWLVLDLPNTSGMLRQKITGTWTQKIPGGRIITHGLNFNPETFQVILRWCIWQHKRKISFDGMLRLYTPPEINHLLAEQGFIIKKTYGSFSNELFSIKTKRYLVMAKKH